MALHGDKDQLAPYDTGSLHVAVSVHHDPTQRLAKRGRARDGGVEPAVKDPVKDLADLADLTVRVEC